MKTLTYAASACKLTVDPQEHLNKYGVARTYHPARATCTRDTITRPTMKNAISTAMPAF